VSRRPFGAAIIVAEKIADQTGDVENQRHGAIAVNGRAREARHLLEMRIKALDDNLLLREELIDEYRGAAAVSFDDHQQPVGYLTAVGLDIE
jgi:hypothetical protein